MWKVKLSPSAIDFTSAKFKADSISVFALILLITASTTEKYALSKDINHPSLRLHKLSGRNNWSVSVSKSYRIMINLDNGIIFCVKSGTHEEVY